MNIGDGNGTSFPTGLDTQNSPEVDWPSASATKARAAVPNDLAAAAIAIETEVLTPSAIRAWNREGDQEKYSTDASIMRRFTCKAASGDIFTLVSANGDSSGQVMYGYSHNFTVSTTGTIGPRDETQACWFEIWSEGGLVQRYEEPSSNSPYTAGGTPTFVLTLPHHGTLYGTDSGSVNALAIPNVKIPALVGGMSFRVKAGNTNTGATTLTVGGITKNVYSGDTLVACVGSEILANGIYDFDFDGTQFIVKNPTSALGVVKAITGSTANNKIRKMTLAYTAYSAGSGGSGATATWTASGGVVNATPTIANGGSGYTGGGVQYIYITGGGNNALLVINSVSSGVITAWTLVSGGNGYGASGTGTATAYAAGIGKFQSVQTTGTGFNVSAVQSSTVSAFIGGSATMAAVSVSVGGGGTAVTYTMGASWASITVATTETVSSVLGAGFSTDGGFVPSSATVSSHVSASVSSGNILLFCGTGVANDFLVAADKFPSGTAVNFNIPYVVGGAA